jgi:hypothetical protein
MSREPSTFVRRDGELLEVSAAYESLVGVGERSKWRFW